MNNKKDGIKDAIKDYEEFGNNLTQWKSRVVWRLLEYLTDNLPSDRYVKGYIKQVLTIIKSFPDNDLHAYSIGQYLYGYIQPIKLFYKSVSIYDLNTDFVFMGIIDWGYDMKKLLKLKEGK